VENYARLLVSSSSSSSSSNAQSQDSNSNSNNNNNDDDDDNNGGAAAGNPQTQEEDQTLPFVAVLPDVLVQAMAWILGEYGYLSEAVGQGALVHCLGQLAHRAYHDPCTRGFVVAGVVKLVAQTGAWVGRGWGGGWLAEGEGGRGKGG
jgi:hypothetical protein